MGTIFYIMEFLDGRFITEAHFPDMSPEDRNAWYAVTVITE